MPVPYKEWLLAIPLSFLSVCSISPDKENPQTSVLPKAPEKTVSKTASDTAVSPPNFLIWLDLAKFKVRLFKNGQAVDSGLVGSGKYYSPVLEVSRDWLIERPSFHPTPHEIEAGRFTKSVPPDRMPMGSVGAKNPQGRGKILLVGFFGIHGTNHPERLPGNISSGCCRMDNLFNDRLHEHLKTELPIRNKTRGAPTKYYYFNKPFTVRLSYSLWDVQSLTDSTLSLLAWKDVHKHLTEPQPKHDYASNDSVKGNGYKLWHLIGDVESKGFKLKDGLTVDSPQVRQFWQTFRKQMQDVKKRAQPLVVQQRVFVKR